MAIPIPTSLSRTRRKRRDEASQLRVLDAAEVEFGAEGFESARMHAIAERAQVALGTLYALFDGKHELYEAIHARRLDELFAGVASSMVDADDSFDAIERGVRSLVAFFVARPAYLAMHLSDGLAWSSADRMRTQVQRDSWSRGFEMMRALFAAAAVDGFLRQGDAETDARLAIAMQQVFMARWLESEPRSCADALADSIWSTIERTFCTEKTRDTEGSR